uniref:Elongation factor 1-gamma 2 n=1 Tax=Triticum urartu TaxID=4572 RepID=A0A8R7QR18_TRIUA
MALVLHAGSGNKNAFKALIAAEYSGVNVELVKDFQMGVSNHTPDFLKMNPIGKVSVLETTDGPVFESNAIARYVARMKADNPLYGSSLMEYSHIEQWIDFSTTEVDANIGKWLYPRLGFYPYVAVIEDTFITALKRALGALDTHLASNTYLVGHSVTLADIVMACNLYHGFTRIMTKSFTSEFPHVERYFWTMVNQLNMKKVVGDVNRQSLSHQFKTRLRHQRSKSPRMPRRKQRRRKPRRRPRSQSQLKKQRRKKRHQNQS